MLLALPYYLNEPHDFIYAGTILFIASISLILWNRWKMEKKKKELILRISHELRTPLTVIKGVASILSTHKLSNLDKEEKELLDSLEKSVLKLERVVEKLSDKSKFELKS